MFPKNHTRKSPRHLNPVSVFFYPQNYMSQFPFLFTYSIPPLCASLLVHALEING
jgi:hypothetical protein